MIAKRNSSTKNATSKDAGSSSQESFSASSLKSSLLKFKKQDFSAVIMAIIVVFICLLSCLLSYFLVLTKDVQRAYTAMQATHAATLKNFQNNLDSALLSVQALSNYQQYTQHTDYSSAWLPIVFNDGYPKYLSGLLYAERVFDQDKDQFIQQVRARGSLYSNFTIYTSEGFSIVSTGYLTPASEYYPITLTAFPAFVEASFSAGYDRTKQIGALGWNWDFSINHPTIVRINSTKEPSAQNIQRFTLPNNPTLMGNATITCMWPILDVYNTSVNTMKGIISGTLQLDNIIAITLDSSLPIYVSIYDMNNTNDGNNGLAYSTNLAASDSDVISYRNAAAFSMSGTVTFLDRVLKVTFTSTDAYLSTYSGTDRWIGVIVSAIACVILLGCCVALFFVNRLRLSISQRLQSKRAILSLKDSHERTKLLLDRLVRQEAKARATVDAVPDFVLIINKVGRVLQTNRNFDHLFGYSDVMLQQGLNTGLIFTALESSFFKNPIYCSTDDEETYIQTLGSTNSGKDIEIMMVVKSLLGVTVKQIGSDIMSLATEAPDAKDNNAEEEEAYTIIGRAVTIDENKKIITCMKKV
jgi:PAS domain-containing protein